MAVFRNQWVRWKRRDAVGRYLEDLGRRASLKLEPGAQMLARELARRPSRGLRGRIARRTLVSYDGGEVTAFELARVLRQLSTEELAQIAMASDAQLQPYLVDHGFRKLVWATANPAMARRHAIRRSWSGTRTKVRATPGSRLLWVADLLFSRKSVEEVLEDTVIDMRNEYFDALAQGRTGKARWVRIRGTWNFLCAAWGLSPGGKLLEWLKDMFR
jgi:hypothetical protein